MEDYQAKEKLFYSATVSAWLNTRLERDKQLLSLSAAAIGVLVALLCTVGAQNIFQSVLFYGALSAFLVTAIIVVHILGENTSYLEKVLDGSDPGDRLIYLDKIAGISFVLGAVLFTLIGIFSG